MSGKDVTTLAEVAVFRPRTKFGQMGIDHVPFDVLTGTEDFEHKILRDLARESVCACVVGPSGAGKSSAIAWICQQLPASHIALRVPISALDDATSVSEVSSRALASALDAISLEDYQRQALEHARADEIVTERGQPGVTSSKLGGGPVPAEVNIQLGTLRHQLARGQLPGDRIAGLERLIQILVANDLTPVFVLEDTEAALGGDDRDRVEGFFDGPIRAFMQEVDAPLLLAAQEHLTAASDAFRRLEPAMSRIVLPRFEERAHEALVVILQHRVRLEELELDVREVIEDEAIEVFAESYRTTGGNLRLTLAAAHSATEYAVEARSDRVRASHARAGASDWQR